MNRDVENGFVGSRFYAIGQFHPVFQAWVRIARPGHEYLLIWVGDAKGLAQCGRYLEDHVFLPNLYGLSPDTRRADGAGILSAVTGIDEYRPYLIRGRRRQ